MGEFAEGAGLPGVDLDVCGEFGLWIEFVQSMTVS